MGVGGSTQVWEHASDRKMDKGRTEHPNVGACVRQNGQGRTKGHEKVENTPAPCSLETCKKNLDIVDLKNRPIEILSPYRSS